MLRLTSILTLALFVCASGSLSAQDSSKITYDDHVRPLLQQKCLGCHNADRKSGGLDMTSYTNLMLGGSSGEVIEPGDHGASYLYSLVSHQSTPNMPPNQERVSDQFLKTLEQWIDGGVLENKDSKPRITKPKTDLSVGTVSNSRPDGPPPMPARLGLEPVLHTPRLNAVSALACNPWSNLLAVSGQQQVVLYDVASLQLIGVLPFPEGEPKVLKFSRDGKLLLAGGGLPADSGRVVVWDVASGERVIEVGDEVDEVLAADISSDRAYVALGTSDKLVKIYSTESGEILHSIKKHTDWITSLEFSPDSVLLASGDRNGGMFLWEASTGREYLALTDHKAAVTDISWRPDSNIVASCSEDGTAKLWELNEGKVVRSINAHGGGCASLEFTRDGRIVTCGRDKTAKLWQQDGKGLRTFPAFADLATAIAFSDEQDRVIAGDWTGAIKVWAAADGKELAALTPNPEPIAVRIASAEQAVQAAGPQAEAATKAWQAAVAKLEALKKQHADQLAAQKAATTVVQSETAKKQAAEKQAADLQQQIATVQKTLGTLKAAAGPLAEAVKNLEAAAKATPTDANVKASLEKAKQAVAEQSKAITDAEQQVKTATEKMNAAKKTATDAATAMIAAKAKADAAAKAAAALQPQIDAAAKAAAEAEAAKKAADSAVATAQAAVTFWKAEADFATQLDSVADLRSTYESALQTQREAVSAMQTASAAEKKLTDEMAAAAKAAEEASAKAAELAKQVASLKAEADAKAAALKQATELQGKLQAVLDAAKQSLTASPTDPQAKKVIEQATASVNAKAAEVATLKTQTADVGKRHTDANTQMQAMTKAKADAEARMAGAKQKLAAQAENMAKVKSAADAAKAAADKAATELTQAKTQLEQVISAGRGPIPQPAG